MNKFFGLPLNAVNPSAVSVVTRMLFKVLKIKYILSKLKYILAQILQLFGAIRIWCLLKIQWMAFYSLLATVKFKKEPRTAHKQCSIGLNQKLQQSIFWYDFSFGHFIPQNLTKMLWNCRLSGALKYIKYKKVFWKCWRCFKGYKVFKYVNTDTEFDELFNQWQEQDVGWRLFLLHPLTCL